MNNINVDGTTITISAVACCGDQEVKLHQPLTVDPTRVDAVTLCRMCVTRADIGNLEKVIIGNILDLTSCGLSTVSTYAELGTIVCKCEHSVKRAVADLRRTGLVATTRAWGSTGSVNFDCGQLIAWASNLLAAYTPKTPVAPPVSSPDVSTPVTSPEPVEAAPAAPEAESKPKRRRPRKPVAPVTTPEPAEEPKQELQVTPVAHPDVSTTADDLAMAAPYDGEFNSSVERAATLAAAGRAEGEGDDDEISLGSETAPTDMGYGVHMNVNI